MKKLWLILWIGMIHISTIETETVPIPHITTKTAEELNKNIKNPKSSSMPFIGKNINPSTIASGVTFVLKNKLFDIIILMASLIGAHQEFLNGYNFAFPTSPMMLLGNIAGLIKVTLSFII